MCYTDETPQILNSKGKQLFSEYEQVKEVKLKNVASDLTYEKNVLIYKKDGKYGLIKFNGKKLTKPIYDSIENLRLTEGKFLISVDGKYGCIDLNGNVLVDFEYDKIEADGFYTNEKGYKTSGFIVAKKDSDGYKYGYINYKGKKILDPLYSGITRISKKDDNVYLVVETDGKYSLYKGKDEIANEYQSISYKEEMDVIIVEKEQKYGILNAKGEQTLDTKYDKIETKGIYIYAKSGETTEIYDANCNKIDMDSNRCVYNTENEKYRITTVLKDNITYYGVITSDGKKLIDEKYRYIEYAFENYFIATNDDGNLGIIDDKGNTVLDMNYKSLQKIKEKDIIQGVNKQTNKTEFYNVKMQKILEEDSPTIQTQETFIIITVGDKNIYLDDSGNKIEDISNLDKINLPNKIGDYIKKQVAIDSIYYSK